MRRTPSLVLALCAMKEESAHLEEQLLGHGFDRLPGGLFFVRDLVVNVKTTGIGMVNSAANASLYMSEVQPDMVVNVGCAGAHDPVLKRGDVVVGASQVGTASVIVKGDRTVIPYGDRELSQLYYPSDETLVDMAIRSAPMLTSWNENEPPPTVTSGRVASSDTWMDDVDGVRRLRKLFGTSCEDMEAAAIASIAQKSGIPFVSIKDISNSVFRGHNDGDFDSLDHHVPYLAGKNAASVAAKTLSDISRV